MQLRGCRVAPPTFRSEALPPGLGAVNGYKDLSTFYPSLTKLLGLTEKPTEEVWLDSCPRITSIDCSGSAGPCRITVDGSAEPRTVYMKVTHRLDPIQWIKGEYSLPDHPVAPKRGLTWRQTASKLGDPWNQAYIDSLACYAFGRLRDAGVSPHFNQFYGAFKATADTYSYNLTDDFDSYRHSRWFWNSRKKGLYALRVVNANDSSVPVPEDVLEDVFTEYDEGGSTTTEELTDSDCESGVEGEVVQEEETDGESEGESEGGSEGESESEASAASASTGSVKTVDIGAAGDVILEADIDAGSIHSEKMSLVSFASETDSEPPEEHKIICDISQYPVMMILTEANAGTMDALLDNYIEVGATPGTPEWEERWSAWIFQVIAGLSVAQEILGFTHNDLHTNNIVWAPTTDEWLVYTRRDGTVFKVPTFGKLFRIIDFGRSIFSVNGTMFISDDFRPENDAGGQYRFVPLYKSASDPVPPNPSFDLCRLAVSLFEALYPEKPEDKEGGAVLSSETGLEVRETVSPLFNVLWSWMIDDEGDNILLNADGSERFPDFYLYKHIAAKVHRAVPAVQFTDPAFDRFQVIQSEVEGMKKWSLCC
jgi:hypothetical protein